MNNIGLIESNCIRQFNIKNNFDRYFYLEVAFQIDDNESFHNFHVPGCLRYIIFPHSDFIILVIKKLVPDLPWTNYSVSAKSKIVNQQNQTDEAKQQADSQPKPAGSSEAAKNQPTSEATDKVANLTENNANVKNGAPDSNTAANNTNSNKDERNDDLEDFYKPCPSCTYLNPVGVSACEICQTPMDS